MRFRFTRGETLLMSMALVVCLGALAWFFRYALQPGLVDDAQSRVEECVRRASARHMAPGQGAKYRTSCQELHFGSAPQEGS